MNPKLIAQKEFNAGGCAYQPGREVSDEELARWPEGSIVNRLKHGFVVYEYAPATEAVPAPQPVNEPAPEAVVLSKKKPPVTMVV